MSKFYILSFDPHKTDANALHEVIEESSLIENWSHYLGSSYVLKSSANEDALTRYINERWPKQRFLIAQIDPSHRNGWMPMKTWEWFSKYAEKANN